MDEARYCRPQKAILPRLGSGSEIRPRWLEWELVLARHNADNPEAKGTPQVRLEGCERVGVGEAQFGRGQLLQPQCNQLHIDGGMKSLLTHQAGAIKDCFPHIASHPLAQTWSCFNRAHHIGECDDGPYLIGFRTRGGFHLVRSPAHSLSLVVAVAHCRSTIRILCVFTFIELRECIDDRLIKRDQRRSKSITRTVVTKERRHVGPRMHGPRATESRYAHSSERGRGSRPSPVDGLSRLIIREVMRPRQVS